MTTTRANGSRMNGFANKTFNRKNWGRYSDTVPDTTMPVALKGFDLFWECLVYVVRIHWIAIKWTFIQLFTFRRSYDTSKRRSHEAELAIVTGGATGIGAEIVRKLYACNMHVIIATPDLPAAYNLKEEIMSVDQNHSFGGIQVAHLDLRSLDSIRDFAKDIIVRNSRLHLLINNAGVMFGPHQTTVDGFETTVQVNYLGPFMLTYYLLPLLKEAGKFTRSSRVINVSSVCHYASSGLNLHTDFTHNRNVYKAYANSKLMQILTTNYMNSMMKIDNSQVMFASVHPGIVTTNLYKNVFYFDWIRPLMKCIYKSPSQGADEVLFAALSPEIEGKGGTFWGYSRLQEPHPDCADQELQRKLFNASCDKLMLPRAPRTSPRIRQNLIAQM